MQRMGNSSSSNMEKDVSCTPPQSSAAVKAPAEPFLFHTLKPSLRAERAQKEFMQLCSIDHNPSTSFATSLKFRHLNRYSDIWANENTIFPNPSDAQHYINGNVIALGECSHTFVGAQAPVPEGLGNWWTTIVESKIGMVIMLTKEVEKGMRKADRYWPDESQVPLVIGKYVVRLDEETEHKDLKLIMRKLSVFNAGAATSSSPLHTIQQVHYLGWPDHGIPESTDSFHEIIRCIERHPREAPILVHCSAGIGRTGTLIGFFALKQLFEREQLVDSSVRDVVAGMKSSRRGTVQRLDQYYFLYQCAMELVTAKR